MKARRELVAAAWGFVALAGVLLVASFASNGHGFLDTGVLTSPAWAWVAIAILGAGWVTVLVLADPRPHPISIRRRQP